DNTAAEFHTTLLSIAPSPLDSNVIWVGTDDGNVQVTRDGGKTWATVFRNVPGLAPNAWIPTVEASREAAGTAYAVADHHQDDDYTPYVYMTTDFGRTWKSIAGDLPKSAGWGHVIREDPRRRDILYFGSELGLWISWDRGAHWVALRGDLPVVPVRDIHIHPRHRSHRRDARPRPVRPGRHHAAPGNSAGARCRRHLVRRPPRDPLELLESRRQPRLPRLGRREPAVPRDRHVRPEGFGQSGDSHGGRLERSRHPDYEEAA